MVATSPVPDVSVVMASFNRGARVLRSVESVLAQRHEAVELVVVDASTDDTAAVLATVEDPRMRLEVRDDLGMPVARNMGVAVARAPWIAFLDDDDVLHPDWAGTLLAAATDEADVVVCGHRRLRPDGGLLVVEPPGPIGVDARVFVAGSFLVRADLLAEVGGMLEGLPAGHHWDLAVRLAVAGARVASVDEALVDIEVRDVARRDLATPLQMYDGLRWVTARHRASLAPRPDRRATFSANIAVPAARLGLWSEARRWMVRAVVAQPGDARHWLRLALACVPPAGRRVWHDARAGRSDSAPRRGLRAVADLAAVRGTTPDLLMLPHGYREATPAPGAALGRPERAAQQAAGALALRLAERTGATVVDVLPDGPGGDPVGGPEILLAAAVLGRAADPCAVLRGVRERMGAEDRLVVGEADREAVDGRTSDGPPSGPAVRRRWSPLELRLVVESAGLTVVEQHPAVPGRPGRRRRPATTVLVARA